MILKSNIELAVNVQKLYKSPQQEVINREWLSAFKPTGNHIEVISGVRRCGKSTLMKQLMQASGLKTAYFNFEDARIHGFELSDFTKLEEVLGNEVEAYFFDEIQNVPYWEVFVRQLHDQFAKVYITGSNAALLSKEMGTRLTGRHLRHELFPFSYGEFIRYKQAIPSVNTLYQYILYGGFPEFLETENPDVLQNFFKDIVLRDIAIRYSIRNTRLLMDLSLYLISNIGKEISYNNLRKTFMVGSANTISDYLTWLGEAYLLFYLPRFSWSAKSIATNPRKVYAVDTGLVTANTLSFTEDRGRLLENVVFMHLRRNHDSLFYFRNDRECDFVVFDNKRCSSLIQVCESLNQDTIGREVEGLMEAMDFFSMKEGYIITPGMKDEIGTQDRPIHVMPACEWLLPESITT
ncbi:MAG: ATP-binding protein [Bacteroidota bacterium]